MCNFSVITKKLDMSKFDILITKLDTFKFLDLSNL